MTETRETVGDDLAQIWSRALEFLGDGMSAQQRAFVALTRPLAMVEDTAVIAAPNDFTKDVLETSLRPIVVAALSRTLGREIRIAVTVDPSIAPSLDDDATDDLADATYATTPLDLREPAAPTVGPLRPAASPPAEDPFGPDRFNRPGTGGPGTRADESGRLNPKYTFDTFVIGSSNRFAHAAAVAVAEQPAKAYNPLFVYGESGLGKTHLLHAIGHYARSSTRHPRPLRELGGVHERVHQLDPDDKAAAFQRRYRDVDILLVDDIQFLAERSRRRKSSSTRSTPCTTRTSRSSSPATCRPSSCRASRTGCASGSSGA